MADLLLGQLLLGGTLQTLSPNASKEEQTQVINDIVNHINNSLKTQVLSDGTSKRMLIGYQANGWGSGKDFGIKVSIYGVDVTTATDAQLLLKFDLQTWFYYQNGVNVGQVGVLPDATTGEAWSKSGNSVPDAFA